MFKKLSLKNRIALLYALVFSGVLLFIFTCIFYVVQAGINRTMYKILEEEVVHMSNFIDQQDKFTYYVHPREWEEIEHTDVALNPVFITIYDSNFKLVENSPNMVQNRLVWDRKQKPMTPYLSQINSIEILNMQSVLYHKGKVVGYMVVGASTKHNQLAMEYLKSALVVLFPFSVIFIFIVARLIASTSTKPVSSIISTTKQISKDNLSLRVPLPENQDELYQLCISINSLVDRLEGQILQAKQFSSDASHELRTPLAVIKGSLEILMRKPRSIQEYQTKIQYVLNQTQRLERLVEQFLLISRVENNSLELQSSSFELKHEILKAKERFQVFLDEKNIQVDIKNISQEHICNYQDLFAIILDNLFSNAIKYSKNDSLISIELLYKGPLMLLCFSDSGIGMSPEQLKWAQQRFYRAHKENWVADSSGSGLGLHIVTQLAIMCGFKLEIYSQKQVGTQIYLQLEPGNKSS
ncbi:sensor histidine kinase [Myroides sp. LJL119]